jgi:hypothetical protein
MCNGRGRLERWRKVAVNKGKTWKINIDDGRFVSGARSERRWGDSLHSERIRVESHHQHQDDYYLYVSEIEDPNAHRDLKNKFFNVAMLASRVCQCLELPAGNKH